MKLPLPCVFCLQTTRETDNTDFQPSLYDCAIGDDNLYRFACDVGHKNLVYITELKFQVLFETGINAIVDGYYREAVTSVTAALERFYEFYFHAVVKKHLADGETFALAWKYLSKQSERQLGAFVAAHLLHTMTCPRLLPQKKTEFRNNVIHRGYIPTRDEAIEYVNQTLNLIVPVLSAMLGTLNSEVHELEIEHAVAVTNNFPGERFTAGLHGKTFISLFLAENGTHPLAIDDHVRWIRENKRQVRAQTY